MGNMKLRISDDLALPLDFITSTQAILAKKRVGKTYTAQVLAEELLAAGQQVVVIDVTSVWWGLRSSADGKAEGYPITIFGGRHGDLPLEATAGEELANAIVDDKFSAVLDVRLLKKGQRLRFIADFLEALYDKNTEAMHLFLDEADAYIPQRAFTPEQARALGAGDELVRRGGSGGIGVTMISQRAQTLNKDVLSQVDMLTVLRMNHPKDLGAIKDWVVEHVDADKAKEMMASLPGLPKGEAWVWAPELGIFKRIHVRQKRTYDSGRTPKVGERVHPPKKLAKVDIERLGERIKATVERAKANDPKELKAEIARLKKAHDVLAAGMEREIQRQLAAAPKDKIKPAKPAKIKSPITDKQIQWIEKIVARYGELSTAWEKARTRATDKLATAMDRADALIRRALADAQTQQENFEVNAMALSTETEIAVKALRDALATVAAHPIALELSKAISTMKPPRLSTPGAPRGMHDLDAGVGARSTMRPRTKIEQQADSSGELSRMERNLLIAIAQHPNGITRKQALLFTGYARSGTTNKAFARLVADQLVDAPHGGLVVATATGIRTLGDYEQLPMGDALRAQLLNGSSALSTMEKALLARACETYPETIARSAALGDYARSGTTNKAFARLVGMGYLTKSRGGVRAAEELFD